MTEITDERFTFRRNESLQNGVRCVQRPLYQRQGGRWQLSRAGDSSPQCGHVMAPFETGLPHSTHSRNGISQAVVGCFDPRERESASRNVRLNDLSC